MNGFSLDCKKHGKRWCVKTSKEAIWHFRWSSCDKCGGNLDLRNIRVPNKKENFK